MALLNKCIEYYEDGNNIDSLEGFSTINTTTEILRDKKVASCTAGELRKLVNGLKNTRVKANLENKNFEKEFDMMVFNWNKTTRGISGDGSLISIENDFSKEIKFINSVKNNEDFCKAIIIKDDCSLVWIVIEECNFSYNRKYIKSAREFKNVYECEFEIIIFDKKQIKEMEEELNSYKRYREIV